MKNSQTGWFSQIMDTPVILSFIGDAGQSTASTNTICACEFIVPVSTDCSTYFFPLKIYFGSISTVALLKCRLASWSVEVTGGLIVTQVDVR
jgi:hypothetical protein